MTNEAKTTDPVVIRGEEFESPVSAAFALGVPVETIVKARLAGKLDHVICRRNR